MNVMKRTHTIQRSRRQQGYTLVELLVALAVSLIAVAGMLLVMSNTVGSTAQVIEATRTSSELRTAMQLITREVRRANFNENFVQCIGIGDQDCNFVTDEFAFNNGTAGSECMSYGYRRYDYANDTWPTDDTLRERGAVRLNSGTLELNATGDCTANSGWEPITDPGIVQISEFSITTTEGDQLLTHEQVVSENLSQRVRKFRVRLSGYSCRIGDVANCPTADRVTRQVETTVRVRNDLIFET